MWNPLSEASHPNAIPSLDTEKERERYAMFKKKVEQFCVLIIGGANASKTTILKKICNTEIYDNKGKKIDASMVEPTAFMNFIKCGIHDIENEMVFRSNPTTSVTPTFVFHNSRVFEAGGVNEFKRVKEFVAKCTREKNMNRRIHVI
ncbi:hypothetical protein BDZ94DRAFT_1171212 [Collybia nuda]|uniref:G domain-containing protein n=1 Tax=Collybia nuda TaxID=64659 RepID=A0A9P6CG44_9AGAR|nr:hypothetical protein BDZ94DRAFT_1171212 [Collybia nuda]